MRKYYLVFFLLFIIDRLSKVYFLKKLSLGSFFNLHLNQNIAFSLTIPFYILYPLLFLLLIFLFFTCLKYYKEKSVLIWPWSLILLGAFSNILDRLYYQAVIDFIVLPYFTVFNLSDLYIFFGVLILIFKEFKFDKKDNSIKVEMSKKSNR